MPSDADHPPSAGGSGPVYTSPAAWLSGVWIATMLHVDWHLGRPGHHLSFGLPYHWVLGFLTFAPLPWFLARRWRASLARTAGFAMVVGVVLGQGLEPLGEIVLYDVGMEPFANPTRWRIFAEFVAAGLLGYGAAIVLLRRRLKGGAA